MSFPLNGVRVLDFTWLNAGAKGTRLLSSYGAETIHIEWKGKLCGLRWAKPPHKAPGDDDNRAKSPNRAASFNNNHVGKWGVSLNMQHPKGKDLFRRLVEISDVIVDNYTATTLERWGFGWPVLEAVNPRIIYVQAPGFGRKGPYAEYRTYGPTAGAISGITWQSGLPDRFPCGFSYSYMDVCGPFFISMAVLSALRQRSRTGKGIYVDLSQIGPAFHLTGTSIPDWSATGRRFTRSGNRSLYAKAAPHGAYRCAGDDKWIAIACTEEAHWRSLVRTANNPAWASDARFASLATRCENQGALDRCVESWTVTQERYDLMARLQAAGVPAGVCQETRDRYDTDPQLKHREFFVQVPHSEVFPYDTEAHPGRFSATPPSPLGRTNWGCHTYGEHNEGIYERLLGLTPEEIAALAAENVI